MSYNIYFADWDGMTVQPAHALEFLNLVSGVEDTDVSEAVIHANAFLNENGDKFEVSAIVGEVFVEYKTGDGGYYWDEDVVIDFLKKFAKFARKDAWIGFIGEDMSLFSCVFNGEGGYEVRHPTINWLAK